ncbi:MAG: hypothetical protein L0Y60_06050 [Beijerinckiaceae bacterium]|nr:hypothetical protein [Beijerinckiaceae bacterium]
MAGVARAETLQPIPEFETKTMTPARGGGSLPVRISVKSWELINLDGVQEIPLQGFYIAHLLSGEINASADGQTFPRTTGDYWSVKSGAAMKVEVLGESAVLETISVAK